MLKYDETFPPKDDISHGLVTRLSVLVKPYNYLKIMVKTIRVRYNFKLKWQVHITLYSHKSV